MNLQIESPLQNDPSARSPLEYPVGLFIADKSAFGGAACFLWFADDASAISHLHQDLAPLYVEESGSENAESGSSLKCKIAATLAGAERLGEVDLEALNGTLAGLCEVQWAGTLDDLSLGNRPFELEVQHDFRGNTFGDERGQSGSDWDDFAHHLTHYCG